MIEDTFVALSDDDVMFSGSRAGSSNQGNSGRASGRRSGKKLSAGQKAAATRRANKRAGMSAAEKRAETRAFKAKATKGGKKRLPKKAKQVQKATTRKSLPKKRGR